jgi:putative ABC transport system permease protein
MFRNYFRTALRNFARNKTYTLVSFSGLSVGLVVCILIFIIIQFESSFDNFHSKKDRIYRVLTEYHHADAPDIFYGRGVPPALPAALAQDFPEIKKVAPIYTEGDDQITVMNNDGQPVKTFKEEKGVFFCPPSFFEIFDFPWIAGNPSVLQTMNTVALTKETAEKYFGSWQEAIGKTIRWRNREALRVEGILASIPSNTDFQLKAVISYGTGPTKRFLTSQDWVGTSQSYGCYILLPQNVTEASFNQRMRAFAKKYKPADDKDSHIIQSLALVHSDEKVGNYLGKTVSTPMVRGMWLIAAFILIIACVNFINLATAYAVNRAKEVGVRKVLGSKKGQLRAQFLSETFFIVVSSVIAAVLGAMALLPSVGRLLEVPLQLDLFTHTSFLLFLLVLIFSVTLLAGFYPAIVLSRFNPIQALKTKLQVRSPRGISLRRVLVVFQFIIAQALIIGTIVVVRQMNYFTEASLGFNKETILNIPFPQDSAGQSQLDFVRKKLSDVRGIQQTSFSLNVPSGEDNGWSTFRFDHSQKQTDFYAIINFSDEAYLATYQLKLVAGRNLAPSDTIKEFLINEALAAKLGYTSPEKIINKEIAFDDKTRGPIVGVLKDYHNRTFRNPDAPMLMTTLKNAYGLASIKCSPAQLASIIPSVQQLWSAVYPDFAFEYRFLDERIASYYKQEAQLTRLYKLFSIVAIFLSCLGLFGLASFMAVQRTKEVGIRKVLGASPSSIVYLFSREFMILISVAFVIASPIAWYFMKSWLQDYVYRINLNLWTFLISGLASMIIALSTISFQAIRAAVSNPVKSLRSE